MSVGAAERFIAEHSAPRPRWRGWLHLWAFLGSIATGIVLVSLAPGALAHAALVIYGLGVSLCFGTSALYHRRRWDARGHAVMKRLDHAMIFVLIAGTYTPICLFALPPHEAVLLLSIVWAGAAVGIALRMVFLGAPRWLYVPLYLGLGWAAVLFLPHLLHSAGAAALVLLCVGGGLYSIGAVIYTTHWPDPAPQTFGFHELFHACTIGAAACHYIAIWFAMAAWATA